MFEMITRNIVGRDEFGVFFEFRVPSYPVTDTVPRLRDRLLNWSKQQKVKRSDYQLVEANNSLFISFRDNQIAMIFRLAFSDNV